MITKEGASKLKEEIKAITVRKVIGTPEVNPIRNVSKLRRGKEREGQNENRTFDEMLMAAKNKERETKRQEPEQLRALEGLNQYNRSAQSFVYLVNSQVTDFTC